MICVLFNEYKMHIRPMPQLTTDLDVIIEFIH